MPPLPGQSVAERPTAVFVLLTALFSGLAYSLATTPLQTVAVTVTLALLVYWAYRAHAKHLESLRRTRPGQSICDFARDFDRSGLDAWVVRAVWDVLQDYVGKKDDPFPIRAGDAIGDALLIDEGDIDGILDDVAQRAGRSLEQTEANPYYGSVRTVGDVVRFLQAQPQAK